MEAYWGVEVQLHEFLTPAPDAGEWSASRPGRSAPRDRGPGTHWTGGWVGPIAGLDAMVKRKISAFAGTRTPDHPARSPALTTELSRLQTVIYVFNLSYKVQKKRCNLKNKTDKL
jgi:hypothetical protein